MAQQPSPTLTFDSVKSLFKENDICGGFTMSNNSLDTTFIPYSSISTITFNDRNPTTQENIVMITTDGTMIKTNPDRVDFKNTLHMLQRYYKWLSCNSHIEKLVSVSEFDEFKKTVSQFMEEVRALPGGRDMQAASIEFYKTAEQMNDQLQPQISCAKTTTTTTTISREELE